MRVTSLIVARALQDASLCPRVRDVLVALLDALVVTEERGVGVVVL
jgi:hypothetical protein